MVTGVLSWELSRPEHDVDNSSPTGDEFKNEWNYTVTPPIRLHGVDRGKCTLLYFYFYFDTQSQDRFKIFQAPTQKIFWGPYLCVVLMRPPEKWGPMQPLK
jgi:hypothetical protein